MRGKEEHRQTDSKRANSKSLPLASTSTPMTTDTPSSRFYYLRGAIGDGLLLEEHKHLVRRLVSGDYAESDLEQLRGIDNVYSFRLNKRARLLFTFDKLEGADYLVLLDYLPTHDYHKSRFLQRGVLKRYLERQQATFQELIEESEEVDLDESLFKPSSSAELKAKLGQFSADTEFDAVALEYYQHRMIELNVEQEKARNVQLPAVISGVAGSGKSCVAFSLLSSYLLSCAQEPLAEDGEEKEDEPEDEQERAPLKVLYVSQSPLLVSTMQENWQHLPHALHKAQVDFKTYQQLLEEEGREGQQVAGFNAFINWYNDYRVQLKKAARVAGKNIPAVAAPTAYQECRIRSGYSAEDYLNLGKKQSQLNREERSWMNEVYQSYNGFLEESGRFAPEFTPLKERNRYNLVVVDEAQDLSHLQLLNLHGLAKGQAIAYCMDSHQRLFDARSVRPYILQKLNIAASSHIELNVMYRCPPKVRAVANEVIAFKHRLAGGTADSHEPTHIEKGLYADDSLGHVYMLDSGRLADCTWMRQPLGTNFAVVTLAAYREEAKRHFNTPLIFTPEEIKGLEYDFVVAFHLYPRALFREAQQRMKELPVDKQPRHQPKSDHRDDHFTPSLNGIYTSYTRARKALIICEDSNPANELLLARLSPIADKGLPSKHDLQQNNYTDWQQEAAKQKAAGNVDLAKAIEESSLTAPQPVERVPEQIAMQRVRHRGKKRGKGRETSAETGPSSPIKEPPKTNSSREEQNAISLFKQFDEKHLTISLLVLDISALLLNTYQAGKTRFVLLEKIIKDNQMGVFARCVINNLELLSKLPCSTLLASLKKYRDKPHQNAISIIKELLYMQQFTANVKQFYPYCVEEGMSFASLLVIGGGISLETFKTLGADVNKSNKRGETAAYVAAQLGKLEDLQTLKMLGADLEKAANNGYTPLHVAASFGHDQILCLFKEWNLNFDTIAKDGVTPAHSAVLGGHTKVLILFKKLGVRMDLPAFSGYMPAHLAVTAGRLEVLKLFYDWDIPLNSLAKDGRTPAIIAAGKGKLEFLKFFHEVGMNLNVPKYCPPIFVAARYGHLEAVKYLIGINCNVTTEVTFSKEMLFEIANSCEITKITEVTEITRRVQDKISEKLKNGDSEEAITLLPIDIAWIMGHDKIVDELAKHQKPNSETSPLNNGDQPEETTLPQSRQFPSLPFFSRFSNSEEVEETTYLGCTIRNS